jgi:hypothetical protein
VLSEDFWRGRFGADPEIVGRPISLNGEPETAARSWWPGDVAIGKGFAETPRRRR